MCETAKEILLLVYYHYIACVVGRVVHRIVFTYLT